MKKRQAKKLAKRLNEGYITKKRYQLEKQYYEMSQRVDKRLDRIEKYAIERKGMENMPKFAYALAMKDLQNYFGKHARRFERDLSNLKYNQVQALVNRMQVFLNSKSSTFTQLQKVWDKHKQAFEKSDIGKQVSWENALDVFESGMIKKYEDTFTYDIILKMYDKRKTDKKGFDEWLQQQTEKHIYTKKSVEDLTKQMSNLQKSGKLKISALMDYLNE